MAEPTSPAAAPAEFVSDRLGEAGGYPGAPVIANPLTDVTARKARFGGVLVGVGSILQAIGHRLTESAHDEARQLVDLAYGHGHRTGWYERGEHVDGDQLTAECPVHPGSFGHVCELGGHDGAES